MKATYSEDEWIFLIAFLPLLVAGMVTVHPAVFVLGSAAIVLTVRNYHDDSAIAKYTTKGNKNSTTGASTTNHMLLIAYLPAILMLFIQVVLKIPIIYGKFYESVGFTKG